MTGGLCLRPKIDASATTRITAPPTATNLQRVAVVSGWFTRADYRSVETRDRRARSRFYALSTQSKICDPDRLPLQWRFVKRFYGLHLEPHARQHAHRPL